MAVKSVVGFRGSGFMGSEVSAAADLKSGQSNLKRNFGLG
jgi:hypothetical protein